MIKNILKFIYNRYEEGIYSHTVILGMVITTKPLRRQVSSLKCKLEDIKYNDLNIKTEIHNIKNEVYTFSRDVKNEIYVSNKEILDKILYENNELKKLIKKSINIFPQYILAILNEVDYSKIIGSRPAVSVLVAIYNLGEKYVRPCIESIIKQTLKNIEIIIVNDASPNEEDDALCKEYARKDDRIKYILHEENTGLGGARMTALKAATGYSVAFVDGDDYLSLNCYEIVFKSLVYNNSDMATFGFYDFDDTGIIEKYSYHDRMPYDLPCIVFDKDIVKTIFGAILPEYPYFTTSMVNKLYKKELLDLLGYNITPEHCRGEDISGSFKIYCKAKSIINIPISLYYHRLLPKLYGEKYNFSFIKNLTPIFLDMKYFLDNSDSYEENYILYNMFYALCRIYWCYINSISLNIWNIDKDILKISVLEDMNKNMFDSNLVYGFLKNPIYAAKNLLDWYENEIKINKNIGK